MKIVGILNITPDSFSDGGLYIKPSRAIRHADKLFADGASLVDVGAVSTRPGAASITETEEWRRLEPVLRILIDRYPGRISVDSYQPAIIRKVFEIGPVIVNDVTGLNNPAMVEAVCDLQASVIISHLPDIGIQQAHQTKPISSVEQVREELLEKAKLLKNKGLQREGIILDPGIGFGKTMELNRSLLKFAREISGYDVMIGYSRKRFLGKGRMELEPNLRAGRIAMSHGAEYLRVHDVAGHTRLLDSSELLQ